MSEISVDSVLTAEKFRLFTMNLSDEELEQISLCRRGILGVSGLGAIFGFFCGRIALGSTPAPFLIKPVIMGASIFTGFLAGAGLSVQQGYNYLKSMPTNLSVQLKKYSNLKKSIYKSSTEFTDLDNKLNEIYNKRTKRLPTSPKE